jgi:hypothetical protein
MADSASTRRYASLLLFYLVGPWLAFAAIRSGSVAALAGVCLVVLATQGLITILWPAEKQSQIEVGKALERLVASRDMAPSVVEVPPAATLVDALGSPLSDADLAALAQSDTSTSVA